MRPIAQRMEKISTYFFSSLNEKIAARIAEGHDVIRLDMGSPDLPPAPSIIEALYRSAVNPVNHGYQPHRGPQALRDAWAIMYRRVFEVELDPEHEVVPLLGSKEGIFHLIQVVVDPGDVVLIPNPGYPTYTGGTLFAGGEPFYIPLLSERNFLPDLSAIPPNIAQRAKMLWLNYPNNPLTAIAPLEFFAEAVEFAREYDLLVCHDAAYTQITYNGYQAPSILQIPGAKEVAVEFNSLSKSHNMAGWRVGVALGNLATLRALNSLKTNVDSGHFLPIMEAAICSLNSDQGWLLERNDVYRQRRDVVIQGLQAVGMQARIPRASLYVWSSVPEGWSSLEFTSALLEQGNISLAPGPVFGDMGEGYVRISLVAPLERISEAMLRLNDWLR